MQVCAAYALAWLHGAAKPSAHTLFTSQHMWLSLRSSSMFILLQAKLSSCVMVYMTSWLDAARNPVLT